MLYVVAKLRQRTKKRVPLKNICYNQNENVRLAIMLYQWRRVAWNRPKCIFEEMKYLRSVLIAIRDKKSGNAGERRNCMMFRELSRIKQKLSDAECVEILKAEPRGVLSVLGDDGYPYGMPMNHWYCEENGHIYFHSGPKGHKVDAVRAHEKVSFCVYDQGYRREGEWALNIKSVIVFGRIRVVENQQEAMEIIRRLSYKYTSDSAYIEHEIQSAGARTLCLELIPEHVCGKLVNES